VRIRAAPRIRVLEGAPRAAVQKELAITLRTKQTRMRQCERWHLNTAAECPVVCKKDFK
jgi:hypothetical protein